VFADEFVLNCFNHTETNKTF